MTISTAACDRLARKLRLGKGHEEQEWAVVAALHTLLVEGCTGVVLADEVGFGKTYEALAIMALLADHFQEQFDRVLVLCKSSLLAKWLEELTTQQTGRGFLQYVDGPLWKAHPVEKLLANVHLVDRRQRADDLRREEGLRGQRDEGRIQVPDGLYVVNQDLLSERNRSSRLFLRQLWATQWDLVIVDEAHHYARWTTPTYLFAPDGDFRNYQQGISLSSEGRILALTATPFELTPQEMVNLLAVIRARPGDLDNIERGLRLYVQYLDRFFGLRQRSPQDPLRRNIVETLRRLRDGDALDQGGVAQGLQALLRRYLIRNTKHQNERHYCLVNKMGDAYEKEPFKKLEDLHERIRKAPLLPFEGPDALFYLELRDLIQDTVEQAREGVDQRTFISNDLRQGLSSYRQIAASALLERDTKQTRRLAAQLAEWNAPSSLHLHPKVHAAMDLVRDIAEAEIAKVRQHPAQWFSKVLVFNRLIEGTAPQLREQITGILDPLFEGFLHELMAKHGERSVKSLQTKYSKAAKRAVEPIEQMNSAWRNIASVELNEDARRFSGIPSLEYYVDSLRRRAQQPLFITRALLRAQATESATIEKWIRDELVHPAERDLRRILESANQEEGRDQAEREALTLTESLQSVEVVGRYDGSNLEDREAHRRNFNDWYYPFVLLVSRVGEEGIDLQQQCRYILHYDLEWNPARMEQREGRVDRVGYGHSGEPIDVRFMLLKGTYEERIFHTVMLRDQWFQILIGSKRRELGQIVPTADDEANVATEGDEQIEEVVERGQLTPEEMDAVMLDLRPRRPDGG